MFLNISLYKAKQFNLNQWSKVVHLYFHTGHVVFIPGMFFFSNIINMSKSEHHIYHKYFDKVNHWYKGTNGMSRNQ